MPKSILVGFDPRAADRAPAHFGVLASRFTGARLVIGSAVHDAVVRTNAGMDEDPSRDPESPIGQLRRELEGQQVQAEFRLLGGGSPPAALHKAAEELDAGMLIVGSSHRGRLGRVLPGSTAERLMHGAPCPVTVVPHGWEPRGKLQVIGVAYADTPEGNEALDSALALAQRAGARVRVLAAVEAHEFGRAAGGRPGSEATSYDASGAETEDLNRGVIAAAARRAPGVEVETDVSVQDRADFLLAASQNVDLLLCGSRGYGPARAVLLGGVSRRVTAAAHCPVIVLARGAGRGLDALIDQGAGSVT